MSASLRHIIAAAHDVVMAASSFVLALYLRLGSDRFALAEPYLFSGTVIFTAIALVVFIAMRLYRGLWRYASLPDMVALVKAVSISIAVFSIVMFAANRLEGIPRSVPFIQWLLLLAMLGGPRFLYRAVKDKTLSFDFRHDASKQIPLLLVGATSEADAFIRELLRDPGSPYRVVGLLDDTPGTRNTSMQGIRIYGGTDLLRTVTIKLERKGLKPQRLVLCSDDISGAKVSELLEEADRLGLLLSRLPHRHEVRPHAGEKIGIRPVAIEDLLGRAQNVHDRSRLSALVTGKRVAVTGAGGSIGAEVCRQIATLGPMELLLLEQSEHGLYQIDLELQETHPALVRRALLCDVRNARQVNDCFARFRPDLVFHAAALKHVPLSEYNPLDTVETNALGTRHVADAALTHGVAIMALISTDKAVHPANIMGASKRLAELYCQALGAGLPGTTRFVTVRFGNVLGSTGSVVPLFTRQLERGGPLTVTHPDMVRYFMTIREAVELVIQAAGLGSALPDRREALFVLDMGKPVRINDLAAQMIRLAGLKPGRDVEIVYTGLRPGEKLFEELFYDAERIQRTSHAGILIAQTPPPCDPLMLKKSLDLLTDHCMQRNAPEALRLLKELVPEFQHEQPASADMPPADAAAAPRAASA